MLQVLPNEDTSLSSCVVCSTGNGGGTSSMRGFEGARGLKGESNVSSFSNSALRLCIAPNYDCWLDLPDLDHELKSDKVAC